jgi:hypothetical protein
MSRVDAAIAGAEQSALPALLNRWPVVCEVDEERGLMGLEEVLSCPALVVVTGGGLQAQLSISAVDRLRAGDVLVSHETSGVRLARSGLEDEEAGLGDWRSDPTSAPLSIILVRLGCLGSQFSPELMPRPFVARGTGTIDNALRSALVGLFGGKRPVPSPMRRRLRCTCNACMRIWSPVRGMCGCWPVCSTRKSAR